MVEFVDGSVKAHLGATDMRIPIQYAMSLPHRWQAPCAPLDFATVGCLNFEEPDLEAFPALGLAIEAGKTGGTAPAVLNAANEVAVAYFLDGKARFTDIASVVEDTLSRVVVVPASSIDEVEAADAEARRVARALLDSA
jgi:1-deoxy-D-xylulose-5-phosphate reductoisomerase